MKKTLAILLAAVMMLGMVACAAPAATEEAPAAEAPAAEAPAEEAPAEEAPAEEAAPAVADLKLGFTPTAVELTNMLEETEETLPASDKVALSLRPFEIKTVKISY